MCIFSPLGITSRHTPFSQTPFMRINRIPPATYRSLLLYALLLLCSGQLSAQIA